jgi:hypothetical protein
MKLFSGLFKNKNLKKELEEVKTALVKCNDKLIERQEVINLTNAYWKKKLHASKVKKNSTK